MGLRRGEGETGRREDGARIPLLREQHERRAARNLSSQRLGSRRARGRNSLSLASLLPFSPSHPRRGLTLYEVLLALVILLGAMTVLAQHIAVGTRAAARGRLETRAALLCEAKLAEVLGGVEPMTPVADAALETTMGTGWSWTLQVAQGPADDLLDLAVTVRHVDSLGNQNASFSLRRLVRDPQLFLDAANAAAMATEETGGAP